MMLNLLLAIILAIPAVAAEKSFHFPVFRTKIPRNEPGQLEIDDTGIRYRADKKGTSITLPFLDIREADLSDPARITIETFDISKRRLGRQHKITFLLRDQKNSDGLVRFLTERIKRPVIGAYSVPGEQLFRIPAYHRQPMGGAHGTLLIGKDTIQFESGKRTHSRTWRYQDIETIGTTGDFQFRISTLSETFNFDLKDRLPEDAFRLAWFKVYRLGDASR